MYAFRCTEQQLGDQLTRITEAGDVVVHAVYKGGRDWMLFCEKPPAPVWVRMFDLRPGDVPEGTVLRWQSGDAEGTVTFGPVVLQHGIEDFAVRLTGTEGGTGSAADHDAEAHR